MSVYGGVEGVNSSIAKRNGVSRTRKTRAGGMAEEKVTAALGPEI